MSAILRFLDMLVELYDSVFRSLYEIWLAFCHSEEEAVIAITEYGLLVLVYWLLYDRKAKDPNIKWIFRILLGMFILYAVYSKFIA